MSKPIIAVARQLADQIRSQEDSLDVALAGQARLIGALLDARRSSNIPARIGTTALDRAFDAVAHGRELRNSMLAVHDELAQMNLRELAVGDVSDCPDERLLTGLSLVPPEESRVA